MKNSRVQYLVGALLLAFSIYQILRREYWEFTLYLSAGLAFTIIGLISNDVFPSYRKILNVVSWVLIITAGFVLLFLARTDI